MNLTEEIMARYYEKVNVETSEVPVRIDPTQLMREISYFTKFLELLPLESYPLDLVQSILDLNQAGLLKQSLTLFRETISVMQKHDLLKDHEFIYSLGVIISKKTESVTMNEKTIDNVACMGLVSVDRKKPIMEFVYNNSICPFCKQPVQTKDFINIILDFNIQRGGLTLQPINKGEVVYIHQS